MFGSRRGCIIRGNIMTVTFISIAGSFVTSVREESPGYTVDFLSVHATGLSTFY